LGTRKNIFQKAIVKILINFITPLQVFIIILVSQFEFSVSLLIQIISFATTAHYIQFFVGLKYLTRNSQNNTKNYRLIGSQVLHVSFPNSLYFITPIILLLFPEELLIIPIIYASVTTTIKAVFLPLQIQNLSSRTEKTNFLQSLKKILLFPPFVGIIFGLIFRVIPFLQASNLLISIKTPISQVTSAVSAILIGISLVGISKSKIKEYHKALYQTAIIRFGLGFIIFLCFGFFFRFSSYQTEIITILLLIICAPPAQNNVIYSIYFQFDEKFSALAVVILTIFGLAILPLLLMFSLNLF